MTFLTNSHRFALAPSFAIDTDGDLASKLLFYSRQDDGTDASGNVANATVTAPSYSAEKIGNGCTYNGSTSNMQFGDVLDFERTDARSWSFWWRFSTAGNEPMLAKGATTGHTGVGWTIMKNVAGGTGYLYLQLNGNTSFGVSELQISCSDYPWDDNVLRHGVITYNGNSLASGVQFYVNGSLRTKNAPDSNNLASSILNSGDFYIGRDAGGAFLNGALDEIGMFSGVLTANNIADLYNAGSGNAYT